MQTHNPFPDIATYLREHDDEFVALQGIYVLTSSINLKIIALLDSIHEYPSSILAARVQR